MLLRGFKVKQLVIGVGTIWTQKITSSLNHDAVLSARTLPEKCKIICIWVKLTLTLPGTNQLLEKLVFMYALGEKTIREDHKNMLSVLRGNKGEEESA